MPPHPVLISLHTQNLSYPQSLFLGHQIGVGWRWGGATDPQNQAKTNESYIHLLHGSFRRIARGDS